MSTIFRLDSSIRTEGSVSRAVADTLEAAIVEPSAATPPSPVATSRTTRSPGDAGRRPPSPASCPRTDWTPEQRAANGARRRRSPTRSWPPTC